MIILFFWILFLLAFVLPAKWSIYLFFSSIPFGTLAVIPTDMTGGITILPSVLCGIILIIKILIKTGNPMMIAGAILKLDQLGILTLFLITTLFITSVAPILFQGVFIMGLNIANVTPLAFSTGNFTQAINLISSYLICLSLYLLLLSSWGRQTLAKSILIAASVSVFAGVMDMVTAGTAILAPLRTAGYALLYDVSIPGGIRRVVGFSAEASSFGALTISLGSILLFVRPADVLNRTARIMQWILAASLLVMTILSTSSGAYVGLAGLAILQLFSILRRIFARKLDIRERSAAKRELGVISLLILTGIFIAATQVDILQFVYNTIDTVVLQKSSSHSYVERSSWNTASLNALYETWGFGLGAGSTRASSWPVAVLSSSGILGGLLMAGFILRCLTARLAKDSGTLHQMVIGARYSFIICTIPAAGAATVIDFGPINATFFALMTALPYLLSTVRPYSKAREHSLSNDVNF